MPSSLGIPAQRGLSRQQTHAAETDSPFTVQHHARSHGFLCCDSSRLAARLTGIKHPKLLVMNVYANGVWNTSAGHGKDSEQGLFKSRNMEAIRPTAWSCNSERETRHWLLYADAFIDDVFLAPLNKRAWVVQVMRRRERHLHGPALGWTDGYSSEL